MLHELQTSPLLDLWYIHSLRVSVKLEGEFESSPEGEKVLCTCVDVERHDG